EHAVDDIERIAGGKAGNAADLDGGVDAGVALVADGHAGYEALEGFAYGPAGYLAGVLHVHDAGGAGEVFFANRLVTDDDGFVEIGGFGCQGDGEVCLVFRGDRLLDVAAAGE